MNAMGERIQRYREARGWSREFLALRAEVSRQYVRLVEGGHIRHVRLDTARRLAAALEVALDDLFPANGNELVAPLSSRRRRSAA